MANQGTGPGTPVTNEQRIRYQSCYNASDYDAPPFAVMARAYLNGGGGAVVDGTWMMNVTRPDAVIEVRQSAADLVFNGPEVLRSKTPGRCTEDYPVRGLHLKSDVLRIQASGYAGYGAVYCGPKADSWLVWNSGDAFRWLHVDGTFTDDKFEAGVIAQALTHPFIGASFNCNNDVFNVVVGPLGVVGSGGEWEQINQYPENLYFCRASNPHLSGADTQYGIRILRDGLYEMDFHCTIGSYTSAPQGAELGVGAYLDDGGTGFYCWRTHQIEIDYGAEGNRSFGNIAMKGRFPATAGQILNFRNPSAHTTNMWATYCHLAKLRTA